MHWRVSSSETWIIERAEYKLNSCTFWYFFAFSGKFQRWNFKWGEIWSDMSFFAEKKILCKFLFIFSKNKKLMIFETFKAHFCSHSIRWKYSEILEILYISLYPFWHRKCSKNVENHIFQNKSFFSIPKELGIQTFYHISFLNNFGTSVVLVFEFQDFGCNFAMF